jgi:hypothetical protein
VNRRCMVRTARFEVPHVVPQELVAALTDHHPISVDRLGLGSGPLIEGGSPRVGLD